MPTLDTTINVISVDDAGIFLGLDEGQMSRLVMLVNGVSSRLEKYCQTVFKARIITKTIDGPAGPLLDIGAPIVAVGVGGVTLGDAILSEANGDYQILHERGQLFRSVGWTTPRGKGASGIRNVIIVATLGYTLIPYEVREAALVIIKAWHFGVGGGGYQSERIGDYAYTRFGPAGSAAAFFGVAADIGEQVAGPLSPYVRHGF